MKERGEYFLEQWCKAVKEMDRICSKRSCILYEKVIKEIESLNDAFVTFKELVDVWGDIKKVLAWDLMHLKSRKLRLAEQGKIKTLVKSADERPLSAGTVFTLGVLEEKDDIVRKLFHLVVRFWASKNCFHTSIVLIVDVGLCVYEEKVELIYVEGKQVHETTQNWMEFLYLMKRGIIAEGSPSSFFQILYEKNMYLSASTALWARACEIAAKRVKKKHV